MAPKDTDDAPETRQTYPEDRFDRIAGSGRIGAHRLTPKPRHTWQYVIAGLLGFALLTTLGIFAVHRIGDSGRLPLPTESSSPTADKQVEAKLDPKATVAVLNGTQTPMLAEALDRIVSDEQWGQIVFSGDAASSDVKISAVFYSNPDDAAAAAGLASKLGGLSTYTTEDYQEYEARLVVLLGEDYAGPGIDEAQQLAADDAEPEDDAGPEDAEPEIDPATGWTIDPQSGYPVDPASGLPTDPATGFVVDPNTGELVDPATLQ